MAGLARALTLGSLVGRGTGSESVDIDECMLAAKRYGRMVQDLKGVIERLEAAPDDMTARKKVNTGMMILLEDAAYERACGLPSAQRAIETVIDAVNANLEGNVGELRKLIGTLEKL